MNQLSQTGSSHSLTETETFVHKAEHWVRIIKTATLMRWGKILILQDAIRHQVVLLPQ